ncbi:MAG: repressor LexA [Elusimicrobia bacterium]|nr:repressor LexA [Elusimicrobiota bacterium]
MSKDELTPRQQKILELVRNFATDHGYPPTVRELCRLAGVSSPDTVQYHLDNLRSKGLLEEAKGRSRAAQIAADERVALIPVLGLVPAGPMAGAYAEPMGHVPAVIERGDASGLFALKVKGDSMESTLWNGDTVVVRWQETASTNDVVVVRYDDGEATVKRLKVKPAGLVLVPDNPKYDPFDIGEGRIAGKVISLIRKL